ncbi:MAG: hypoxanthine phosphoribosyltransferase [Candidatus Eremiobacteraeota bacterium]|nr:hypoxanthine phosphoribosyltransferase [Candidatus Eremiobacteraeota bacterium]
MFEPVELILYTEEQIEQRIEEMGRQISKDFAGKDLLVICVLKGALYFTADLIRHIDIPLSLDFIAVTSYGNSTTTSGIARLTKDLEEDVEGRHIIITEDILDTGLTMEYLVNLLKLRNPADIKICTMLDKTSRRITKAAPDYVGFTIPEHFVVGYGLDHKHRFRHIPFICTFRKDFDDEEI